MSKTIVVCGYGPGISTAVAERFGAEGFQVALVARRADNLAAGVAALEAKGVRAAAFSANLADPDAARGVIGKVFVGEVMVFGLVRSPFDRSATTIDARTIAEKFWDLYRSRTDVYARVP